MVLFIPLIGIIGTVYFVGGDIQNVKVFYHNDEHDCMLHITFVNNASLRLSFSCFCPELYQ